MSNRLGLWGVIFFTLGNIVGSGVLGMPSDLAFYNLTAVFIGLLITSLCAFSLAYTFSELNRCIRDDGGPHIYSHKVFGEFVGFQMAWAYWIFSWSSNAALCISAAKYISFFYPPLEQNKLLTIIIELSLLWSMIYINTKPMRSVSFLQSILTSIKIAPLFVFALHGFYVSMKSICGGFNLISGVNFGDITKVLSITLWAFVGIESAVVHPAESENVKKGSFYGVALSAFIYIFSMASVFSLISQKELINCNTPFVDATRLLLGNDTIALIVASLGLLGIIFTLNGWVAIQGQVPLSMAREKIFPVAFLRKNKNDAPVFGLCVGGILISLMIILMSGMSFIDQFMWAAMFSTFTIAITYFYASMAAISITLGSIGSGLYIHVISTIYSMVAIISIPRDVMTFGTIITFCISVPVYVMLVGRRK